VLKVEVGAEEEEQKHARSLQQISHGKYELSDDSQHSEASTYSINAIKQCRDIVSLKSPTVIINSIVSPTSPKSGTVYPFDSCNPPGSPGAFGTTKNAASVALIGQRIKNLD